MIALVFGAMLAFLQSDAEPTPGPTDEPAPGFARGRMPPLPPSFPPLPPGAAVVRNSGSTNSAGYTLAIAPDGRATLRQYDGLANKTVAAAQTRWLFSRLKAAGPLDSLGIEHCMKSASFGTSTTITWNGTTSGDVSCSADPASRELVRTINVIVTQLDISTFATPAALAAALNFPARRYSRTKRSPIATSRAALARPSSTTVFAAGHISAKRFGGTRGCDLEYAIVRVEKIEIERRAHSERVYRVAAVDPQTFVRRDVGFAQEADQTRDSVRRARHARREDLATCARCAVRAAS